MGCIETFWRLTTQHLPWAINFNMGCIETKIAMPALKNILRLTLTWDVLKLRINLRFYAFRLINFNMVCIETYGVMLFYDVVSQINFNMRCIKSHERPKHKE